jgi:hypothetical protein
MARYALNASRLAISHNRERLSKLLILSRCLLPHCRPYSSENQVYESAFRMQSHNSLDMVRWHRHLEVYFDAVPMCSGSVDHRCKYRSHHREHEVMACIYRCLSSMFLYSVLCKTRSIFIHISLRLCVQISTAAAKRRSVLLYLPYKTIETVDRHLTIEMINIGYAGVTL